jgi:uncharacterized membrane protein YeaQ/YmgE (transglycosylase-associated protein family)
MNVVLWLFVGGVMGWIAGLVMHADDRQGFGTNVMAGVAGALIGGWIVTPMIGGAAVFEDALNVAALMVSLAGAILLVVAISVIQRRTPIKIS